MKLTVGGKEKDAVKKNKLMKKSKNLQKTNQNTRMVILPGKLLLIVS